MNNLTISLLTLIIIHCSCKNSENEFTTVNIKAIPENAIIFDMKAVFEELDYVYLAPNGSKGLVGDFSKILFDGNSFFVFQDITGESSVCKFSRNGNLLFQEISRDEGPGKFMGGSDIALNNENEIIEILDAYQSKIIFVSKNDGAFIKEIKLPYSFNKFVKLENDGYAFYAANSPTELGAFNIYIKHQDKPKPRHFVPINPNMIGTIINHNCFSTAPLNKSYLYSEIFSNILWRVSLDTVMPAYRIDFGERWVDEEALLGLPGADAESKMAILNTGEDKIQNVRNLEEFEESIYFNYYVFNKVYWNFYNKGKKKLESFYIERSALENPNSFDGGPIPFYHYGRFNEYLILGVDSGVVHRLGKAAPVGSKFKQFAQTVPEEGNPVIILAKLKKKYQ